MTPQFNEFKATQVAAMLLRLRGGQMHYLKLIKLLYLVDREALVRWGRVLTTDRHVSMNKGPVVSQVYELINQETAPGENRIWRRFISEPCAWQVHLEQDCPTDELSLAEKKLVKEIFIEYGYRNRWELVDYAHTLPEWQDPQGSSIPIKPEDILRAAGMNEEDVDTIVRELAELALVG